MMAKTVRNRVVTLVDKVGQQLFEHALPAAEDEDSPAVGSVDNVRARRARRRSFRLRASL